MAQDLRDLPPPNYTRSGTYRASDVVTVDEETAKFLEDSEKMAETMETQYQHDREANTSRALYKQAFLDYFNNTVNGDLLRSSDAYFDGHHFAIRVKNTVKSECERKWPLNREIVKEVNGPIV